MTYQRRQLDASASDHFRTAPTAASLNLRTGKPRGSCHGGSPVVRLMVLGSLVRSPMGVLRRYDVAKGTAGIAGVVLPLNLVLNVALVLPNLLPGLDPISASLVSLIVRQSRRNGADDEGSGKSDLRHGERCRISFSVDRLNVPSAK